MFKFNLELGVNLRDFISAFAFSVTMHCTLVRSWNICLFERALRSIIENDGSYYFKTTENLLILINFTNSDLKIAVNWI